MKNMKLKTLSTITIGVFALAFAITPAFATTELSQTKVQNNDVVTINNCATVTNDISSTATTGGNFAGGSYAGNGGNGGNANVQQEESEDPKAGNGGDGGNVTKGGQVTTGDASVGTDVKNEVNTNDVSLERSDGQATVTNEAGHSSDCTCSTCRKEKRAQKSVCAENNNTVTISNSACVKNEVDSEAKTGKNTAEGSMAGNGGQGGDANVTGGYSYAPIIAGNGGKGGNVEAGGSVTTGKADTWTNVFNLVNKNILRIKR